MATPVSPPAWVMNGGASALPHPACLWGMGQLLPEPDGTHRTLSEVAPAKGCHNEAELRALMAALAQARAQGAAALVIYCDSRLLVDQFGAAQVKPVARLTPDDRAGPRIAPVL